MHLLYFCYFYLFTYFCDVDRTIDSFAVGYGKGRLTFFLGDIESIVDVVSQFSLHSMHTR